MFGDLVKVFPNPRWTSVQFNALTGEKKCLFRGGEPPVALHMFMALVSHTGKKREKEKGEAKKKKKEDGVRSVQKEV